MRSKCRLSHCHRPAANNGYCSEHYQPQQKRRFEEHVLYKTARWIRISKSIRAENPICQKCGEQLSAVVDHIIEIRWPNSEDFWHDENNLMALCHSCHNEKTRDVARTLIQGKPNASTLLVLSQYVVQIPQLETIRRYFKKEGSD